MAKVKTQSKGAVEEKTAPEVQESESVDAVVVAPPETQVSIVDVISSETPASTPVDAVVVAEALPAVPPISDHLRRKYRVKVRTTISYYGQMVVLPVDTIVSAEGYGPEGLQRIIDANVPLEKLE